MMARWGPGREMANVKLIHEPGVDHMIFTRRFAFFFLVLALLAEGMTSQTLTSVDSDVWNAMYGSLYRLNPDPSSLFHLVPPTLFAEATGPIEFELSAEPASIWALSLLLPDSLIVYEDGRPIYCTYGDSSGYHVQNGFYWNASRPHIFIADSLGKIAIGVGMIFGSRDCPIYGNYTANVVCLATRLSDGVTLIDTSHLTIASGVTDQCGFGFDDIYVNIANLTAGFSDIIGPQSGSIQPVVTGQERGGPIHFASDFDSVGTRIRIDFLLPKFLEGDEGRIPISFSSNSAREASGVEWDPGRTHFMSLDQHGRFVFDLGFTIEVPDTTEPGEYYAQVIWFISYEGNGQSDKIGYRKPNRVLEPSAMITVRTLPPIPRTTLLYQNFPNPFNASTTIRYDVPVPGDVSLRIYDLLGRETTFLVNGFQFGGEHSVQLDAATLPSGVYISRLRVGTFTQSQKMILAR